MPNPIVNYYKTADGRFIQLMMLQGDRVWPEVCELIERPELITDERFAASKDRFVNRVECIGLLREAFAARAARAVAGKNDRPGGRLGGRADPGRGPQRPAGARKTGTSAP